MRKALLISILSFISLPIWADFTVGDFTYAIEGENATLTHGANIAEVIIPETVTNGGVSYTVTKIGDNAFYNFNGVRKVTMPQSITNIGISAFDGCRNLTDAPLPLSLERMEGYCFYSCPISEAVIPEGCSYVGYYNYAYCTYLEKVSFPATLETLEEGAFAETPKLKSVTIADGCQCLQWCDGMVFNKDLTRLHFCPAGKTGPVVLPSACTAMDMCAFQCAQVSSITLSDAIKEVPADGFRSCENLTNIDLRNVKEIGKRAFFRTSKLKHLSLPNTLIYLDNESVFAEMDSLEEITIPDNVKYSLGSSIFSTCKNLKRVIISSNITSFKGEANFKMCPSLEEIICKASEPYKFLGNPNFLQSNYEKVIILVPTGCKDGYKSAPYWGNFRNIVACSSQENSIEPVYVGNDRIFLREGATLPFIIKNTGTNDVNSITFYVTVDGQKQEYTLDNLNLPPGQGLPYSLSANIIPAGMQEVTVGIETVNNKTNGSESPRRTLNLDVRKPKPIPSNSAMAAYSRFEKVINHMGGEKSTHIDAAHFFADSLLVGKQVVGMKIQGLPDQGLHNVKLWYSQKCVPGEDNLFVPDGEEADVEIIEGQALVAFNTPILMSKDGLYFGISFDNDMSGSIFPICQYATDYPVKKAYLFHGVGDKSFSDGSWNGFMGSYGVLGVTLYIEEGVALPGKVIINKVSEVKPTLANQPSTLTVGYQNFTGHPIKSIECEYDIEGTTHSVTVELPEAACPYLLMRQNFTAPIPALGTSGSHSAKLSLGKADGIDNPEPDFVALFTYYVGSFQPTHRPLVEEFTGTGCGWCPRGTLSMNLMDKEYDRFPGVAYHGFNSTDPMFITDLPYHFYYAPAAVIDRKEDIDPYYGSGNVPMGIKADYERHCYELAPGDLSLEATLSPDSTVNAKASMLFSYIDNGYSLCYLLTIDSIVHPELEAWRQGNFYEGESNDDPLINSLGDGSYDLNSFNHVAIDCSHALNGNHWAKEDLVTGEVYSSNVSFDLHHTNLGDGEWLLEEDLSKINVIAFLKDDDGLVRNAIKVRVGESTTPLVNMNNLIEDNKTTHPVYFDLMGRQISNPKHGIYIKKTNMKTIKVLK